ncbi:MAG: cell wall metabolism sensor histidine kinase WalK [Oscillospiraceae bacterium]|nr:cell wall metabolism sensor histidine kinase WalK [Oscillospiraceae bacterium]
MFKSIQWRLVIIFIIVAIALVMPVGLVLNNRVEAIYYDRFVAGVESGFRNWQVNEGAYTLDDMLQYLRDEMNATFLFSLDEYKTYTVIDKANINNIVHSSDGLYNSNMSKFLSEILGSHNLIAVLGGAQEGKESIVIRADSERFYDYARLVRLLDGEYIIYFRYNSAAWSSLTDAFSNAISFSIALALLIATVSGYLLARTITDPIKTLMNTANRIANGDLDQAVEAKSDDEIGKLTDASNKMAKALKANLEEITSEKNKQENILNYSQDGIISYNMKGEVILSNPAATEKLGHDLANTPFDAFAARFEMGDRTAQGILDSGELSNWELTVEYEDRALEIYCSVFSDIANKPGGIIAVIHDVTEQQRLENMRREFVANVSHELRTPLTSIISYSESLLDGGIEDRETSERFLNVIHSEADRMAKLVSELLQLSRFDNNQARWSFGRTDIVMTVKSCVEHLQISAQEKSQALTYYVFGGVPDIWADKDKLAQVFINVIGNAIKYTHDEGNITVYISRMAEEVHIKVSDTGIGIPSEDIPRLTERFFRVDKARSREMGGTGLGLSIAEEIIGAHQGSMSILSELGKGTDVLIRLPIDGATADADTVVA